MCFFRLKPSGRLGAAATPNASCCSLPQLVSVAASGNGETMLRDSFALQVGLDLAKYGMDEATLSGIRERVLECSAGFVALRKLEKDDPTKLEVVFSHATSSFPYGYFAPATMLSATVVMSRAGEGICASGAHVVRTHV